MKIALLTPEYPHPDPRSSGGIGTSIKNLAIGLLAEGCSVRILVYGQKVDGQFDDNGVCVQQVKNIKFKGLSWYFTQKKIENIVNKLYLEKEIDIIEAPDWTGITSFISPKKCPIVIRLHGSDTYFCYLDQRPVKWINKFHEKRALIKASGLLSVSQFTADLTNEVFNFKKQFTIIPNGIDTDQFKHTLGNNASLVPSSSDSKILYYGSLIRKKGLLELPLIFNEVVKKYPTTKLILIGKDVPDIISGNPSTWKMMQELFTQEALTKVNYVGSVAYQDIKKHVDRATVCVFPTFAEALPVSWIEAMAMQKAMVTSNIGWATEVINDGVNGFLVHPTNHIEYANRIVELLKNAHLRNQFGTSAREKVVVKFSIEKVAKQSLSFYKSLIN